MVSVNALVYGEKKSITLIYRFIHLTLVHPQSQLQPRIPSAPSCYIPSCLCFFYPIQPPLNRSLNKV